MAFIDLTIERPAWKRVEYMNEATETDDEIREVEPMTEMDEMMDEAMDDESSSRGGMFSMRRLLLGVAMVAVATMAARRMRARKSDDSEMETPIDVEAPAETSTE